MEGPKQKYGTIIGKFLVYYRDFLHYSLILITLSGCITLSRVITLCVYVVADDNDYPILGGITNADEDDPSVIEAAKFAVSQIDATDNRDNALRLVRMSEISKVIVGSSMIG